jgi:D-alanine-D-alanine ligase
VGISKVKNPEELRVALEKAFLYDVKVLVEEYIPAREIECAVLGNENPTVFPPGEIIPSHEFYDYDAKYRDPEGAALKIPAALSTDQEAQVKDLALRAYKALELCGMARVDFFIDKRTGKLSLNEVNTIPGFTAISMYPRMCQAGGLSYPDLIDSLIDLALRRHTMKNALKYNYAGE